MEGLSWVIFSQRASRSACTEACTSADDFGRALKVNDLSLPTRAPRALFAGDTSRQIMRNALESARAPDLGAPT